MPTGVFHVHGRPPFLQDLVQIVMPSQDPPRHGDTCRVHAFRRRGRLGGATSRDWLGIGESLHF